MCCFIIVHSEPLRNTAGLPCHHSFFSSSSSSLFLPILLTVLLTTSVDGVDTISGSLCTLRGVLSLRGDWHLGILECHAFISALFYHLYSLMASQRYAQHQAVLSLGTLINKDFIFILGSSGLLPRALGIVWSPVEGRKCRAALINQGEKDNSSVTDQHKSRKRERTRQSKNKLPRVIIISVDC